MAIAPADGQKYAEAIRQIYDQAELLVLQKIATRVAKDGSISDDHWLKRKEAEIGRHRSEIDRILKKFAIDGPKAMSDLIVQGYLTGVLSADGDLIDAGAKMVEKPISFKPAKLGEAVSVTGTFGAIHASAIHSLVAAQTGGLKGAHMMMIRQAEDAYRDIIYKVAPSAVAGVETRLQATQRALTDFANKGIGTFVDRAGKNWDIASYAEMATRTSMAHAQVQGHINRMTEQGRDLVIVSHHPEPSRLCRPHEGKVYSISGNDSHYPALSWAIGDGLFHPNCRHTINAYIEGLTDTPEIDGDPDGYDKRQKQRYMERQVRYWKKRQAVAITPKEMALTAAKVKDWNLKLRDYVKETGGVRDYSRTKVYRETLGKGPAPTGKIPPFDPAAEIVKVSKEAGSEVKDMTATVESATPISETKIEPIAPTPKTIKEAAEMSTDGQSFYKAIKDSGDPAMAAILRTTYDQVKKESGLGHTKTLDAVREIILGHKKVSDFRPKPVEIKLPDPKDISSGLYAMARGTADHGELEMWLGFGEKDEWAKLVSDFGGDKTAAHKFLTDAIAKREQDSLTGSDAIKRDLNKNMSEWERSNFRLGIRDDLIDGKYILAKADAKYHIDKKKYEDADGRIDWDKYFTDTKQKFAQLVDKSLPTVRVSPTVLSKIVNGDGRFKTQFETGTSGGMFSPGGRKKVENELFGAPNDMDAKERPIYGLLDDLNGQTDRGGWYGSVKVRLRKASVWDRSTVTIGDSLDYRAPGMKVWDPDTRVTGEDILAAKHISQVHKGSYTEFQVFGGVSLGDVERVDVQQSDISGPEVYKTLRGLETAGIQVRIYNNLAGGPDAKNVKWATLQQWISRGMRL